MQINRRDFLKGMGCLSIQPLVTSPSSDKSSKINSCDNELSAFYDSVKTLKQKHQGIYLQGFETITKLLEQRFYTLEPQYNTAGISEYEWQPLCSEPSGFFPVEKEQLLSMYHFIIGEQCRSIYSYSDSGLSMNPISRADLQQMKPGEILYVNGHLFMYTDDDGEVGASLYIDFAIWLTGEFSEKIADTGFLS